MAEIFFFFFKWLTRLPPLPYLVEFPMAVFLSLRNVKYLVHVGSPLLPGHSGEQQAGYQKVGAAESGEDVAFKFLHV